MSEEAVCERLGLVAQQSGEDAQQDEQRPGEPCLSHRGGGGFESRPLRQNRRENMGKCKEKEKHCYGCKHLYSEFGAAGEETYFCKKYGIILAQQGNWIQSNPLRCDQFFEEIGGGK